MVVEKEEQTRLKLLCINITACSSYPEDLMGKATVEMPHTCMHSLNQQWATPAAASEVSSWVTDPGARHIKPNT